MSFIKNLLKRLIGKDKHKAASTGSKPQKETPKSSITDSKTRPARNPHSQKPQPYHKNRSPHPHHSAHKTPPKSPALPDPPVYKGKPFDQMGLNSQLTQQLHALKFINSTEVQEKSIPEILNGNNVFCSSQTGSGKTFSFLLPMIHKFYHKEIDQSLIICPTREIAIQIQSNIRLLAGESVTSALVIGGTSMIKQRQELAKYPQILVATPGRLLDMLGTGLIWLQYTGYVVLDEADRMLDMGFEPDLIRIHEQLTGPHQTVLFSATLFPQIKKMAARYAQDFKEIVIGNPARVANSVTHVVIQVSAEEKEAALRHLMLKNPGKMIVFFNTINDTAKYARRMSRVRGARVGVIHSKVDQAGRQVMIEDFRENRSNVLMASDVASRGIDIPNVDLVVNFDIPNNCEEYIHRVGRTGRAGQLGRAISFYTHKDKKKLDDIETLIKGKVQRVENYKNAV